MDSASSPHTLTAGDVCRAGFWRSFAPNLHVGAIEAAAPAQAAQSTHRLQQRMARDGYFSDRDPRLMEMAPALGGAIKKLVQFGLPPVLLWVYDEPWECFRRLRSVIGDFLGPDYKLLPAFWAWHVDPSRGETGWRPHRDNERSLAANGTPNSLTCWIPLSDATPMNGCMYIVPAHLDPNYGKPGSVEPISPYVVRALPGAPGDFFIWNQAVQHWGSMTSEFGEEPRMSMALEFQRGDIPPFQQPLLDQSALPPFEDRVRMIARQVLQYTHMYRVPEKHVQLAQFLINAPLDAG